MSYRLKTFGKVAHENPGLAERKKTRVKILVKLNGPARRSQCPPVLVRQKLKNCEPVVSLGILPIDSESTLDQRSAFVGVTIDIRAATVPASSEEQPRKPDMGSLEPVIHLDRAPQPMLSGPLILTGRLMGVPDTSHAAIERVHIGGLFACRSASFA